MKICKNCGVELDETLRVCPLCGRDPEDHKADNPGESNTPMEIVDLHRMERKTHLWELSGIIFLSAICVCTIVDLVTGNGLSWALYADTSCAAVWIILSLLHFRNVKPILRLAAFMLTILLLLFLFNLFSGSISWFVPLALPIVVSIFLLLGIILLFRFKLDFMGFNLLGVTFFAIAIFCILTETIIDLRREGSVALHWSLIAASSIMPLSAVFFFMHYRLKRGNRLDSFFHV